MKGDESELVEQIKGKVKQLSSIIIPSDTTLDNTLKIIGYGSMIVGTALMAVAVMARIEHGLIGPFTNEELEQLAVAYEYTRTSEMKMPNGVYRFVESIWLEDGVYARREMRSLFKHNNQLALDSIFSERNALLHRNQLSMVLLDH